jgi:hypothetical protein
MLILFGDAGCSGAQPYRFFAAQYRICGNQRLVIVSRLLARGLSTGSSKTRTLALMTGRL